jgi:DNA-binding NarL/FixJ family response regulator
VGGVITVGAIDDDRMLLEMLKNWMAPVPDVQLIHIAATVDEYVQLGVSNQIVLLDLNLKDDSSPAENVVRLTGLGSKVLVVSIITDHKYVIATLEAGAEGYLTKNHGPEELVTSIRQIAAGDLTPSQELAFAVTRDTRPTRPKLSPQERRLLSYYARGMTLDAVARKIGVSRRTAEDYLNRVKKKYEDVDRPARTKLELAQRLREDGLEDEPRL